MRQLLRERIKSTTNAGNPVDVSLPQIKPGQAAYITHIALTNASGESVTVLFGITSQGDFTQIWPKQTVAQGDAYGAQVTLPLLEGDRLTARVTGTSLSGPVTFAAGGELHDNTPDVVTVTEVKS